MATVSHPEQCIATRTLCIATRTLCIPIPTRARYQRTSSSRLSPHLSTTSLRAPTHTLPTLASCKKMSIDAFPVSGLRLHQLRASQKERKKVRQTAIDLTVDPGDGLLWPSRGCRDEVPLLVSRIKSSAFMQISWARNHERAGEKNEKWSFVVHTSRPSALSSSSKKIFFLWKHLVRTSLTVERRRREKNKRKDSLALCDCVWLFFYLTLHSINS